MKNICDWNNCFEIGQYKAPVEKDNSKKYRLLCLKHVKEFIFWQNVINIAKLNSERKPIPLDYQQNLSFLKFYPKNLLVESLLQFLEYQIINNRMKYCYDITNILSEQKLSPIELMP